ncbi:FUSC family protein [Mycobacterium basiliense]|uniref:FUSC family protein n=1 Tax=Mycobacterium basiliense TaxID=2094119 RepID=UPI0013011B9F|nr:FUSC family protein [Mycobacterium basiliense]
MLTSTLSRTRDGSRTALRRLRGVLFPIAETATAAGLAWYLAHDVIGHQQPFFAPIAAAVCLSASDVLRTQRAVQMIIGVTFGIGLGAAVQTVLGTGAIAIAVAVFISLCCAVLIASGYIAQGLMFFNQVTVSATLVISVSRSADVVERLEDTLLGGGLAIVFAALLFPGNPLKVLRHARANVLAAVRDLLVDTADVIGGRATAADWPLRDVDRVHGQLGALIQARVSARQTLLAPRRWGVRASARRAEQQTVRVGLFAESALHLSRVATAVREVGGRLPPPVPAAIADLAAAATVAETDLSASAAHIAAARACAAALDAAASSKTDWQLASAVQACVDDLQQAIDLEPCPPSGCVWRCGKQAP